MNKVLNKAKRITGVLVVAMLAATVAVVKTAIQGLSATIVLIFATFFAIKEIMEG